MADSYVTSCEDWYGWVKERCSLRVSAPGRREGFCGDGVFLAREPPLEIGFPTGQDHKKRCASVPLSRDDDLSWPAFAGQRKPLR